MNIWSDCKKLPLTEVLSFIVDNRGKTVPTTTSGHILIATNCIKNDRLYPCYEKIRFLSEDTYQSFFRSHPIPGDILFVCKGTPGRCALVPDPIDFCIAQDMVGLRTNKSIIDNKYLLAVLRSYEIQKFIYNTSVGDVIPHFKKQFFNKLLIPVPPMELQTKIGAFYYSISQKIENNNKINANLEAQAQALFKSWFVDFTPFKDQPFVDSELGPIPQGWKVEKINDLDLYITDFVSNGSFASLKQNVTLYSDENYAFFIRNTDLKEGRFRAYVDKSSYFFLKKSVLHGGEIIISNVGDVGSVNLCPKLNKPMTLGNNIIMLKSEDEATHNFLYILFKWSYGKSLIKSITGGSAQPKFNKGDFKSLKIIMPTGKKLSDFNLIASSLLKKIEEFKEENQRLAALRDTLLPKLMSGEIKL